MRLAAIIPAKMRLRIKVTSKRSKENIVHAVYPARIEYMHILRRCWSFFIETNMSHIHVSPIRLCSYMTYI